MKIAAITQNVPSRTNNNKKQTPSFGSLGMPILSISGSIMQWIESKGYFMSFLIQDGLGMTLPRAITGFNRDKNKKSQTTFTGRKKRKRNRRTAVVLQFGVLCGLFQKSYGHNPVRIPLKSATGELFNRLRLCFYVSINFFSKFKTR